MTTLAATRTRAAERTAAYRLRRDAATAAAQAIAALVAAYRGRS